MADFRDQIREDIADYRAKYPNVANINKDDWAFNFWVLGKLFNVEEELIESQITEYSDLGADCYVWHEDLHDLYIIQNKFFSDNTRLTNDYVQNDFLVRTKGALEKGTYTRCKELQDIYTKFSCYDDFCLHYHIYVTNNTSKSPAIIDGIAAFNAKYANERIDCHLYSLDDIQELYFGKPVTDSKSFTYQIQTINKGTILAVNNEAYKLTMAVNAKYVLTPVLVVYKMYKEAQKQHYSLFDDNIREFLGTSGAVNKKMAETLKNPNERNNFFFYNNGITMIVSKIGSERMESSARVFDVTNPQIVNGCQTVSTIFDVLSSLPEVSLSKDFSNTFVMIKILEIPSNDPQLETLYRNIVTYNNSQNAIDEKTFTAIQNEFRRLQTEFEWRGFLVCIKQSDKFQFANKYKSIAALLDNNRQLIEKFSLQGFKKATDFTIDLNKLLQIFLAFVNTPQDAIQNKSKLLKDGSIQNQKVVDFIKNPAITTLDKIHLMLLYMRADQEKNSGDGKSPNPFYLIFSFSRYECTDTRQISDLLGEKDKIDAIIKKHMLIFKRYYREWVLKNPGKEYNDMIKAAVDCSLLDKCKDDVEDFLETV